jgi:hypothetical protein
MIIEITFEHRSSRPHEKCDGIHTAVIETSNYRGIYVIKDTDSAPFNSYSVKAVTTGKEMQLETIITGLNKLTEQAKFDFIDQLAELYNNKTIHGSIHIAY